MSYSNRGLPPINTNVTPFSGDLGVAQQNQQDANAFRAQASRTPANGNAPQRSQRPLSQTFGNVNFSRPSQSQYVPLDGRALPAGAAAPSQASHTYPPASSTAPAAAATPAAAASHTSGAGLPAPATAPNQPSAWARYGGIAKKVSVFALGVYVFAGATIAISDHSNVSKLASDYLY